MVCRSLAIQLGDQHHTVLTRAVEFLAQAARHRFESKERILKQRSIISKLERAGHDRAMAVMWVCAAVTGL